MNPGLPVKHCAVMSQEVVNHLLAPGPAVYVDCTLGAGGHSRALLEAGERASTVIGIDRDNDCIAAARDWGQPWRSRLLTRHGNFRDLGGILQDCGHPKVDGILFDLGVSSHQLDTPARGFSFRHDGPLDMRMDVQQESSACSLVNRASGEELRTIFRTLGQERWAGRIAKAIVKVRGERLHYPHPTPGRSGRPDHPEGGLAASNSPGHSCVSGPSHGGQSRIAGAVRCSAAGCGGTSQRRPPRGHCLPLPGRPAGQDLYSSAGKRLPVPSAFTPMLLRSEATAEDPDPETARPSPRRASVQPTKQ